MDLDFFFNRLFRNTDVAWVCFFLLNDLFDIIIYTFSIFSRKYFNNFSNHSTLPHFPTELYFDNPLADEKYIYFSSLHGCWRWGGNRIFFTYLFRLSLNYNLRSADFQLFFFVRGESCVCEYQPVAAQVLQLKSARNNKVRLFLLLRILTFTLNVNN